MATPWRLAAAVVLVAAVAAGCRPETDVPPGDDIRDEPTADAPLGGQTRAPGAESPPGAERPREPQPEPSEPATPLRPAPGGSED